jgi:iron complex outermembrane receptor protein
MSRSPAQADISIRGSTFEQVLVLIDGNPMSDAQTGHFDMDLAIPLDQVERIEILRGPASASYGTDAMGGAINVVTKSAVQSIAVRLEGGSFGTVTGSLGGGIGVGKTRLAGGAAFSRSDGHRPGTDYRVSQLHLKAETPLVGGALTAQLGQSWKHFGAADFYAPFASYEETRTTRFAASWRRELAPGLDLVPRVSVRRHKDYFVLDRQDPASYANAHSGSQIGVETVIRYRSGGIKLAAGGSMARDALESSNLGNRFEERWALFAEAVAGWGSFTLNTGVRGDHYQSYGFVASPSLSAAYWIHPLRLRGSFGGSYRAPTWTELYYVDPYNRGRQDLRPERGWTTELGADLWVTDQVSFALTVFNRRSVDLIDWARSEAGDETAWETRNVERATFRGLEAEVKALVAQTSVSIQGAVTNLVTDHAAGFVSKYALRPMVRDLVAKAGRGMGPITADLSARYRRRQGDTGHWLLDLRVALPARVGEVYLDLTNGLGTEYEEVPGVPAAGRAVVVGFRTGRSR